MKGLNFKMNTPALAARIIRVRAAQTHDAKFQYGALYAAPAPRESRAASPMRAMQGGCLCMS